MLDTMKNNLLRKAGQLLGSPAAISLLSNPQFQDALKRAINLRSDVRDTWETQMEGWARQFNLVTRQDLKTLKRTVRELENHIASMDYELQQMKTREASARAEADAARAALAAGTTTANKTAVKKTAAKKAAAKKTTAKKTTAKNTAAKNTAAKNTAAKNTTAKKTTKRSTTKKG